MDPITDVILSRGISKVLDAAFTLVEAGLERETVLAKVAELEQAGHTPDQIADDLVEMRKASSAAARSK